MYVREGQVVEEKRKKRRSKTPKLLTSEARGVGLTGKVWTGSTSLQCRETPMEHVTGVGQERHYVTKHEVLLTFPAPSPVYSISDHPRKHLSETVLFVTYYMAVLVNKNY